MNRPLITQLKETKNRLKITGSIRVAFLDAAFLEIRGYFRLTPVGSITVKGSWDAFWDCWEMHKTDLKAEGLRVDKEKGQWVIFFKPPEYSKIELDESIRYV